MNFNEIIKFLLEDKGLIPGLNNLLQILVVLVPFIIRPIKYLYIYIKQRYLFDKLEPYFSEVEVQKAAEYFIPTKGQYNDPAQEDKSTIINIFIKAKKLIPYMIKIFNSKIDNKYYLILGDIGVGKTTFLINLFLTYKRKIFKRKQIKLLPLGRPQVDDDIDKIQNKENIILLLDAFDEDTLASDNNNRLQQIINLSKNFHCVVITCRTQFFSNNEEEPSKTDILKYGTKKGVHSFNKIYLSYFDNKDINKYLAKVFPIYNYEKRKLAKMLVNMAPDLMIRPMLLGNIQELVQDNAYSSLYEIYEKLIDSWINRERVKNKHDLLRFTNYIARYMYDCRKNKKGLYVNTKEFNSFAKKFNISLNEFEMKSRSLLNRNAEGNYKFSHKSILEYILANILLNDPEFRFNFDYSGMDLVKRFYAELIFFKMNYYNGYIDVSDDTLEWVRIYKEYRYPLFFDKELEYQPMGKLWSICRTKDIYNLTIYNKSFDLSLLAGFPDLKSLELKDLSLDNLKSLPIKKLKSLIALKLENCGLNDIEDLDELINLRFLYIAGNKITDLHPLQKLNELEVLDLARNINICNFNNMQHLIKLENLRYLILANTNVRSLLPIESIKYLTHLDLSHNPIVDYTPLLSLTNLITLYLSKCKNIDISDLVKLQKLKGLFLLDSTVEIDFHDHVFESLEMLAIYKNFDLNAVNIQSKNPKFRIIYWQFPNDHKFYLPIPRK